MSCACSMHGKLSWESTVSRGAKHVASDVQAEPITYLHAGMIQHDAQGNPAFMHRTAEGKMYPFNNGYRRVSTPLCSFYCTRAGTMANALAQAVGVLKGCVLRPDEVEPAIHASWLRGAQADYLTVPLSSRRAAGVLGHDFKKMGLKGEQVDHATYAACPVPSLQRFHLVRVPRALHGWAA